MEGEGRGGGQEGEGKKQWISGGEEIRWDEIGWKVLRGGEKDNVPVSLLLWLFASLENFLQDVGRELW